MSLTIKRAETHRAAKRLARLTGESVTDAGCPRDRLCLGDDRHRLR